MTTVFVYREDTGYTERLDAITIDQARARAQTLARAGDWGLDTNGELRKSAHIEVDVIEYALPEGARPEDFDCVGGEYAPEGLDEIRRETVSVVIEPEPPGCIANTHDFVAPVEVVGGMEENPGVQGHGGGVIVRTVCRHCGLYRIEDTWDQTQGPEPVESVRYESADDAALRWIGRTQPMLIHLDADDEGDREFAAWLEIQREFHDETGFQERLERFPPDEAVSLEAAEVDDLSMDSLPTETDARDTAIIDELEARLDALKAAYEAEWTDLSTADRVQLPEIWYPGCWVYARQKPGRVYYRHRGLELVVYWREKQGKPVFEDLAPAGEWPPVVMEGEVLDAERLHRALQPITDGLDWAARVANGPSRP